MFKNIVAAGSIAIYASCAQAQSVNDLVQVWLAQHNKTASPSDYQTCQATGGPDQICAWNAANLGTQPTAQQLQALVPAWQAQQAALAQYTAVVAIGSVQVVSTGTPSLSGTYGIALNDKLNASAVTAGIAAGQGLPGSGPTFAYLDVAHQPHSFTSDQWLVFAKALRDYVYDLALAATGQGSLPATPITIP